MDSKHKSNVSHALWIPLIWMMLIASRYVSLWLNWRASYISPEDILEGSSIDRNVFMVLIVAGLFILSKRRIYWSQILQSNKWFFLLFLYFGISILWSDFPVVAFKRWIKAIGDLVMVLVVLTDRDPVEAVKTMIRRCAYILIPLSILFIRYYPDLGKLYDPWEGKAFYVGVATSKNMLGNLCLVCGFFFFWNFFTMWRNKNIPVEKKEVFVHILFLLMISWLLLKANSATSVTGLVIGIFIVIGLGLPIIKRNVKYIGIIIFLTTFAFLVLHLSTDLFQTAVLGLGRDTTFTGRVDLWKKVIHMNPNPLIGTGFESFWLGDRLEKLWTEHWWHPNQAHNGYVETYLNLGWIGLSLLIGVIFSSYRNIHRALMSDFDYGRFRMAFLVIALVYNITEAAFKELHPVWFIFLIIALSDEAFAKVIK